MRRASEKGGSDRLPGWGEGSKLYDKLKGSQTQTYNKGEKAVREGNLNRTKQRKSGSSEYMTKREGGEKGWRRAQRVGLARGKPEGRTKH